MKVVEAGKKMERPQNLKFSLNSLLSLEYDTHVHYMSHQLTSTNEPLVTEQPFLTVSQPSGPQITHFITPQQD